MLTRNLGIALVFSVGIHLFSMSAVSIISPEDFPRARQFTEVTFLGPILKKTAFDIMIENVDPVVMTSYSFGPLSGESNYLDVAAIRIEPKVERSPVSSGRDLDILVSNFLTGSKGEPEFFFSSGREEELLKDWRSQYLPDSREREVIYRPVFSPIMRGLYGSEEAFRIKVKVLIDAGGKVKRSEPLTTTGYPRLDILASKYVKSWIFEPSRELTARDEWQIVEVVIKTTEGGE